MRDDAHDAAMAAMDRAEELAREQLLEAARETYEEAAQFEQRSADAAPVDRPRTRGVLRVSAVSLWMRARRYEDAARLARRYLQEPLAAGYARELHELLNEIEARRAALGALPRVPDQQGGELLRRLKERETQIVSGIVPLVRLTNAA
ncbi:MAG: hypothetical protein KF729_23985 [Sandaracinaceae bacterium]|nr:hypothetical protein [Sandaracinaceae bacterium]